MSSASRRLDRLLRPRRIAVIGGRAAESVVRQCHSLGYAGDLWAVHPSRPQVAGVTAYASVSELPAVPDAAFVGVGAQPAVEVIAELAALGCGGAVVYASGFAEVGGDGLSLQRDLVAAAGEMPLLGPNCMGVLDYRSGAALWPDQHGGDRLDRPGVAVITQSGNIALNLTMQRRGLPLAAMLAVGNCAVTGVVELLDAYLARPDITAVGLHLEQVPPLAQLLPVARRAAALGKPLVVLRTGRSAAGARASATHTAALAGDAAVAGAVLRHCGCAEVADIDAFIDILLLAHTTGGVPVASIVSASCSGGEAALIADLAADAGVDLPELSSADRERLDQALGGRVAVDNPLDYHTYVWGDPLATRALFDAVVQVAVGLRVLVLDLPRSDRCDPAAWEVTLDAWVSAATAYGQPAAVLATMAEAMPPDVAERLVAAGITPLCGVRTAMAAVASLARSTQRQRVLAAQRDADVASGGDGGAGTAPHGADAMSWIAHAGLRTPRRVTAPVAEAGAALGALSAPVVMKTAAALAHKSDVGGVRLGLWDAASAQAAALEMAALDPCVVLEEMIVGGVAELLVSVRRDPLHGVVLALGSGGTRTEIDADSTVLVGSITREEVHSGLESLRCWPLLTGFRGGAPGDLDATIDSALALVRALQGAPGVAEVEVNPVIVLPAGQGAVAVDAVVIPGEGCRHE